jgi:hypothetical protein
MSVVCYSPGGRISHNALGVSQLVKLPGMRVLNIVYCIYTIFR